MKISDLPDFDITEMLKTDEDIANYLTAVLEENNEGELTHALGVIARARGMSVGSPSISQFITRDLCG